MAEILNKADNTSGDHRPISVTNVSVKRNHTNDSQHRILKKAQFNGKRIVYNRVGFYYYLLSKFKMSNQSTIYKNVGIGIRNEI